MAGNGDRDRAVPLEPLRLRVQDAARLVGQIEPVESEMDAIPDIDDEILLRSGWDDRLGRQIPLRHGALAARCRLGARVPVVDVEACSSGVELHPHTRAATTATVRILNRM